MSEGSISVRNKERVTQMVNIFTPEHQQWTPYLWFRSLGAVLAQLYIITLISLPWVSGQWGSRTGKLRDISLVSLSYGSVLMCSTLQSKKLHAGAGVSSFLIVCCLIFRDKLNLLKLKLFWMMTISSLAARQPQQLSWLWMPAWYKR